ncbi:DUF4097 family beta strand repeat-containing protein [Streptomyces sp. FXJ1.172]|uniref:DUF4097 family beta strand repeat-containing protein n=1 Tax=Streptomyces sp. FXJ1.172 TaxID=710705 RepID=UPI0007CF7281|nr:DUF4097 family beta strand repeat-containing protein [Streptomyces sp. FXJ1.172]WEO97673.1 DUF4097 family beta strand repeat-containing protein [Streptomyces sp. FXJ1.172]
MARSIAVRTAAMAVVTAALVATVSACGASASDDKHPDHRSFALGGRTLTVDSDDAALEIVAAQGNKAGTVQVTRWFKGKVVVGGGPKVSWSFQDDRLKLRMQCSGFIADCSAKYRIEVPRGIGLKVTDSNGSVQAQGFADPVSIRSSNGSVHVTDSTGPLQLHSSNGAVRAQAASRQVRAETSNGAVDLDLSGIPDLVDAHSSNGAVTITVPHADYRVRADSTNGKVTVSVPRSDTSPHTVTAGSSNGRITVRTAN